MAIYTASAAFHEVKPWTAGEYTSPIYRTRSLSQFLFFSFPDEIYALHPGSLRCNSVQFSVFYFYFFSLLLLIF